EDHFSVKYDNPGSVPRGELRGCSRGARPMGPPEPSAVLPKSSRSDTGSARAQSSSGSSSSSESSSPVSSFVGASGAGGSSSSVSSGSVSSGSVSSGSPSVSSESSLGTEA